MGNFVRYELGGNDCSKPRHTVDKELSKFVVKSFPQSQVRSMPQIIQSRTELTPDSLISDSFLFYDALIISWPILHPEECIDSILL